MRNAECGVRNEVASCQGSVARGQVPVEERFALIVQVASFGTALIVQMANCKWQVASFGTLRVDCRLS